MAHKLILPALVIMLVFSACQGWIVTTTQSITGSGTIVSEDRSVSGFSSIQVYLGAGLALTQGDSEGLTIEADDNFMPFLSSDVRNGTLVISKPDNTNLSSKHPIQLRVTFRTLSNIEIFGSSDITAADLDLDTLGISFSGSGSTRLSGQVDTQNITIKGQAMLHNFDLASRHVNADISGNGVVEVNAVDTLGVTVAGIGTVRYTGSPSITRNVMGVASINPR